MSYINTGLMGHYYLIYNTAGGAFRIVPREAVTSRTKSEQRTVSTYLKIVAGSYICIPLAVILIAPWYDSLPLVLSRAGEQTALAATLAIAGATAGVIIAKYGDTVNEQRYRIHGKALSLYDMEMARRELRSIMWTAVFCIILMPVAFFMTGLNKMDRNVADIFILPFICGATESYLVINMNPVLMVRMRMGMRRRINTFPYGQE